MTGQSMAAKNTGSMAPGAASSSRASGIGGSPRSKPQPASVPIFVAEKLFDEFSLGRINARQSSAAESGPALENVSSIGNRNDLSRRGRNEGFMPSAPPFECIGRSNAEQLYGFNDIFGGVPGIKVSSRDDDVFAESNSKNPHGATNPPGDGSPFAPVHNRSSSSSSVLRSNGAHESPRRVRLDADANQSQEKPWSTAHARNTSGSIHSGLLSSDPVSPSSTAASSNPLPNAHSANQSGRPHGSSRLRNSVTELKSSEPCDRQTHHQQQQKQEHQDQQKQEQQQQQRFDSPPEQKRERAAPPYVVKKPSSSLHERSSSTTAPQNSTLSDQETSAGKVAAAPSNMPSFLSGVANCSPRLIHKLNSESKEAPLMKPQKLNSEAKEIPTTTHLEPPSDKRFQDRNHAGVKEKSSVVEEVLLPQENGSWNDKKHSDLEAVNSSPRKARRPSATERLKAALFPDFSKKEDKAKAKSWFTVGDLKLVTQPTDVPPPNRAPPDMDHAQESNGSRPMFKRDERWRRNSCEFPLSRNSAVVKEAPQSLSQTDREDFRGLSSSVTAMKEAVERAEARIKQKQKSAEVFPETTEHQKKSEGRQQEESLGDLDKRVLERSAHELREKALKKAAERDAQKKKSAARTEGGDDGVTSRSTSAPKQRLSDEAERNAKKVFFSGEQCKPVTNPDALKDPQAESKLKADEERKQRRSASSDKTSEERAAKVLAEKNKRDLNAQQEEAEKQRVSATVDARIKAWVAGKEGNLRALLLSLQDVLWTGSGWQPVSPSELSSEALIRKAYRRATLCVHPDKIQQRTIQEKLIAEKVFDLLMGAWNRFNSQEAFFLQVS